MGNIKSYSTTSLSQCLYCIKQDKDDTHNKLSNINLQLLGSEQVETLKESPNSNPAKEGKTQSDTSNKSIVSISSKVNSTIRKKSKFNSNDFDLVSIKDAQNSDKKNAHKRFISYQGSNKDNSAFNNIKSSTLLMQVNKEDLLLIDEINTRRKIEEFSVLNQIIKIQQNYRRWKEHKAFKKCKSFKDSFSIKSDKSINNISNILKEDKNVKFPPELYKSLISNRNNPSNYMSSNMIKEFRFSNDPGKSFINVTSNSNDSKANKLGKSKATADIGLNSANMTVSCKFYKSKKENEKIRSMKEILFKIGFRFDEANAFGIKTYTNNSSIIGFFNGKNEADGIAYYKCSNNSSYKGMFVSNYLSGFGYSQGFNECCYVGEWLNSKQDGFGIEIWQNGSFYKGNFSGGKKHGYGSYFWKNGASYLGEWEKNKMEGYGILKFETGNIYYGEFKSGSMTGFGDFIWSSGKSFSGFYQKDLKEGLGLFYWNNPVEIYFGYWVKGQRDGPAIQITSNGKFFTLWSCGKQIKQFKNKQEALNYCQSSSNLSKKYKKFFSYNLEDKVKAYSKRNEIN